MLRSTSQLCDKANLQSVIENGSYLTDSNPGLAAGLEGTVV